MKIGLIGNCQLEVLGVILKDSLNAKTGISIALNTPLYKLSEKDIVNLFFDLENCDLIFGQYYGEEWGRLGTENLKKYFDIALLPTLESRVSFPQLGYWGPKGLPENLVYVDYRFLHLYLNGIPMELAPKLYTQIVPSESATERLIAEDVARYRKLHADGLVVADYSPVFEKLIRENRDSFFTVSHPNNAHLEFLLNNIMAFCLRRESFTLSGQELLKNYWVPKLGTDQRDYYMMRPSSLRLAAKIFYEFFSTIPRPVLEREFANSNYARLLID